MPHPLLVYTEMDLKSMTSFSLVKDGESYIKQNKNDPWSSIGPDMGEHSKQASFILHHSLLVRNEDIEYLGQETINGKNCYVIRTPQKVLDFNTQYYNSTHETQQTHYFNTETGLLELLVSNTTVNTLVKTNNQTTTIESKIELYFEDYKPVEGVLFPLKQNKYSYGSGNIIEDYH